MKYRILQHANGDEMEAVHSLRVMQQEQRDGQTCRWIEYEVELQSGDKLQRFANRYLFPESSIVESEHPFLKLKEWASGRYMGPVPIAGRETPALESVWNTELTDDVLAFLDRSTASVLHFPGVRKRARSIASKTDVKYSRGVLVCEKSLEGALSPVIRESRTKQGKKKRERVEVSYKLQRHAEVPFGIAGGELKYRTVEIDAEGKEVGAPKLSEFLWKLDDFGVGAKSAFPNQER